MVTAASSALVYGSLKPASHYQDHWFTQSTRMKNLAIWLGSLGGQLFALLSSPFCACEGPQTITKFTKQCQWAFYFHKIVNKQGKEKEEEKEERKGKNGTGRIRLNIFIPPFIEMHYNFTTIFVAEYIWDFFGYCTPAPSQWVTPGLSATVSMSHQLKVYLLRRRTCGGGGYCSMWMHNFDIYVIRKRQPESLA